MGDFKLSAQLSGHESDVSLLQILPKPFELLAIVPLPLSLLLTME
jgi:hypothetical protein